MRLAFAMAICAASLAGQTCVPAGRLLPSGTVTGTLDAARCKLSDGTFYAAYRLDLPARGQVQIDSQLPLILRDAAGIRLAGGASIHRPIEAGSYTVVVNGAGDYTVKTAFMIEPGMMCDNLASIGLNQAVEGALGASGCAAPDGSLFEGYTLATAGAGTLRVTAESGDFAPRVTVRGLDGVAIATAAGSVEVAVDGDSQYEIRVASMDNTGAYRLTMAFQPADSETCRARGTLSGPVVDNAVIAADSCAVTLEGSGDLVFYNYYDVTVSAAGVADWAVASRDFNGTLTLLDEDGNSLATDEGGAGGGQPELRLYLAPGKYTLQVFSQVLSGGAYTLNYGFQESAPKACAPAALHAGDRPAGALTAASCRTDAGLTDLYTLALPSSGTVELAMTSGDFNARLAIRDTRDNVILANDDVDGTTDSRLSADLPAGTYVVAASATAGAGAYQLTAGFTAHDIPACTQVQDLDLNGGYIQRLGPASCRAANGEPVDYYRFTLPQDSVVAAVMTSSQVDGHLRLLDQAGNELRSDDNTYLNGDPLIVQYLAAGSYRLAARAASSSTGGLYEVDLRTVPGPRPPFCAPRGTLALGASATGSLSFASCQYPDATFADVYRMDLAADTTVDLRLSSAAFDAYVVLLDARGNVVDQDDDSGGGTNARLQRPLAAGTYYVVAKPFGDYTSAGAYTLALSEVAQ